MRINGYEVEVAKESRILEGIYQGTALAALLVL